ncbi:MAG: CoA-binding protein [Actinomycetota bacterium]|nr:CoA-binding protein [Actinomycetota bacterium]
MPPRMGMAIAAGVAALSAWGGAAGLIGGFLSLGDIERRLPFDSPVLGGIALALWVAVPFTVLAARAARGRASTGISAVCVGALVIAWIVVQMLIIRQFSFFQPLYIVVGAAFAVAGWRTRGVGREVVDAATAQRFLAHDRIALVGASADPKKFGNVIFRALRDAGHEVVPVNPRAGEVEGIACVRRIADLPDDIDAVMIMLTGDDAAGAVEECGAKGVEHVWLFRGAGQGAVSRRTLALCRTHGFQTVPGACPLMFLEPVASVHKVHLGARRLSGAVSGPR